MTKPRKSDASALVAFQPVLRAFARDVAVTAGSMFSKDNVVLKVNGRIFAMLANGIFVAKLPRSRVEAMVAAGEGARYDPGHGRVMKEWIATDQAPDTWVALAREARAFVGGIGA